VLSGALTLPTKQLQSKIRRRNEIKNREHRKGRMKKKKNGREG
jgi:hypothetical protein